MPYVLYHTKEQGRPQIIKMYNTEKGARIGLRAANRNAGADVYWIMEELLFNLKFPVGTKTVRNLMTGKDIEIAENTPLCCDPSSETFWSM